MRDAADSSGKGQQGHRQEADSPGGEGDIDWGKYESAIRRWEAITGQPAPTPTEFGPRGNIRLSSRFTEWMMGIPLGWVTGMGFARKHEFRLLGNGVVPQQAVLAIKGLLDEESDLRSWLRAYLDGKPSPRASHCDAT